MTYPCRLKHTLRVSGMHQYVCILIEGTRVCVLREKERD
jgi:hypothetical protein